MERKITLSACLVILLLFPEILQADLILGNNWHIKRKAEVAESGNKISLPGCPLKLWIPAMVPGTVQIALVGNGLLPEPYYGMNNRNPNADSGTCDPSFLNQDEWWYRTEFDLPVGYAGKRVWLNFDGINYKANIWLNGRFIGDIKGMFVRGVFDVTSSLNYETTNALAVEIIPPGTSSFSSVTMRVMYGWDQSLTLSLLNKGIWRKVYLKETGQVVIKNPYIIPHVSKDLTEATLDISCEVSNAGIIPRRGTLKAKLGDIEINQDVSLGAGETETIVFPTRHIRNPELWWPNGYGEQNLYDLNLSFVMPEGDISDELDTRFGIRELEILNNEGYFSGEKLTIAVNHRKIYAKGASWLPLDAILRLDREGYDRKLRLFREGGFNFLRVWSGGIQETEEFYDLCDEYGIMCWQDFPVLGVFFRTFPDLPRDIFFANCRDSILRLRNRASLVRWSGGVEFDPDEKGNRDLVDGEQSLLDELDPLRAPDFIRTDSLGWYGVEEDWHVFHKGEPYVNYRLDKPEGFQMEFGLQALPVLKSVKKFIPEKSWTATPEDPVWGYHNWDEGVGSLLGNKMGRYINEYGTRRNLQDWINKSALTQGIALQFQMEWCRTKKYECSGCCMWQYQSVWPACNWAIVDWWGYPKPGYYFFKRASSPLHILAGYDSYVYKPGGTFKAAVYVANDYGKEFGGLKATARIYALDGRELFSKSVDTDVPADSTNELFTVRWRVPKEIRGSVFFMKVALQDSDGKTLSSSFYWFAATKKHELDERIYEELDNLAKVDIESSASMEKVNGEYITRIILRNPAERMGFLVWVEQDFPGDDEKGQIGGHINYSDNYFFLTPGESKDVTVTVSGCKLRGEKPRLFMEGWNVTRQEIPVTD